MLETDEYVAGNSEGIRVDLVTFTTAYQKMKSLCCNLRNEIFTDIEIHNQHILPRYCDCIATSVLGQYITMYCYSLLTLYAQFHCRVFRRVDYSTDYIAFAIVSIFFYQSFQFYVCPSASTVLLTSPIQLRPSIVWNSQIDCVLFLWHALQLALHHLLLIW